MKKLGLLLVAAGIVLIFVIVFNVFFGNRETISPVPDDKGIKVIFISPGK